MEILSLLVEVWTAPWTAPFSSAEGPIICEVARAHVTPPVMTGIISAQHFGLSPLLCILHVVLPAVRCIHLHWPPYTALHCGCCTSLYNYASSTGTPPYCAASPGASLQEMGTQNSLIKMKKCCFLDKWNIVLFHRVDQLDVVPWCSLALAWI